MNGLHAFSAFAVLVLAGLLSGCAALTVSVDVYKGPLANDEHVLTEQTAVMAIGAKPLLKQLRCEVLQAATEDREQINRDPECDVDLDTVSWRGVERAKRVRAVSTLYEDRPDNVPRLSRYFSFVHMKQEEFETALNTLQGDREEEKRFWRKAKPPRSKEFGQAKRSRRVLEDLYEKFKVAAENKTKVEEARQKLIPAVNQVMVIPKDTYRRVRDLLYAFVQLDRLLEPPRYEVVRPRNSSTQNKFSPQYVDLRIPYDGQTTPAYALLAQEEVRQQLTLMLFGNEESERTERYMERLASIASSFLATRQAVQELWIESIGFLEFLNDPPLNDKNLQWIDQWIEEIEAGRPGLTLAIAPLIAALTDVQDIAVMIYLRGSPNPNFPTGNSDPSLSEQDIINTLRDYLVEQSRPEVWAICPEEENCNLKADWSQYRLREARRALEFAIIARPEEMADLLLESDRIFREIPYTDFKKLPANGGPFDSDIEPEVIGYAGFQQKTGYKQGDYRWEYYCGEDLRQWMKAACRKTRSFGITEVRRRDLSLRETLQRNIAVVEEAGGVGLGKGRLPQGLDTLIEEYIEAAADAKPDVEDIKFKRERLLNALVRFAEKVLVIANHQELLDPSGNNSPNKDDRNKNELKKEELNKYVVTLQAIGNAIIVQVDDLIRRQSHRDNLERRALAEIEALKRAAAPNAEEALARVRQDLEDISNGAKKALDDKEAERAKAKKGVADKQEILDGISNRTTPLQLRDEEPDRKLAAAIDGGELEFHAWRTISGEAEELPVPSPAGKVLLFVEDKSVLERDAEKIRSRILKDHKAAKTPMAVRQDIEAWISGETPPSGTGTARYSRLTKTKEWLTEAASEIDENADLHGKTRQSIFEKIKAFIKRQYIDAKKEILRAADIVFKPLEDAAREELEAAEKHVQQLKDEVTKLEERKKVVADAMAVTRLVIDGTLQPMIQADTLREGAAAFASLQEKIEQREARFASMKLDPSVPEPKKDEAEAKRLRAENALAVLDELRPPLKGIPGFHGQGDEDKPPLSQLDVLDSMIAHLRYEHIRAEQEGRPGKANQIQQALDSAYEQRAGMAFIRPSAAFLRSSYAGTGLQDDPGLAWRNMLREHGRRAWGGKEVEGTTRVIAETDKQFWQNINKVRVDGGGRTNYVLAKDDVGNWYVKAYSTDRKAIFQSARNLALFGAGAALDLNLLERMTLEQEFQEEGPAFDRDKKQRLDELRAEQPRAGTPTALRGVFDRYRAQYNDMTDKAHAKLLKQLAPPSENSAAKGTELGARIRAAWGEHTSLEDHLGHLGKALLALSNPLRQRHDEMGALDKEQGEDGQPLSPDAKAQQQAAQVIDALRSVADFEAGLVSVIERDGELPSFLAAAAKAAGDAEGEYEKARQEREGLERELEEKRAEFANKGKGVAFIEGDAEEIENQKNAAVAKLNEEAAQNEQALSDKIGEAKGNEIERKTAFDKAVKDHDAVRQAQQLAKATVAGIAGTLFRDVLADRRQTVREYETAITYVGDLPSK